MNYPVSGMLYTFTTRHPCTGGKICVLVLRWDVLVLEVGKWMVWLGTSTRTSTSSSGQPSSHHTLLARTLPLPPHNTRHPSVLILHHKRPSSLESSTAIMNNIKYARPSQFRQGLTNSAQERRQLC